MNSALKRWIAAADLRFAPSDEAAFKKSLEAEVAQFSGFAALMAAAAWIVHGGGAYLKVIQADPDFQLSFSDVRSYNMMIWLYDIVISLGWSLSAYLRYRWGFFKTWNWEKFVLVMCMNQALVILLGNEWHGPLLWGMQPNDVWPYDARFEDTSTALALDTTLTAVCLFIPLRSCVVWILPVLAITVYCFLQLVVGAPFPDSVHVNIAIMFLLAFFAFFGAWRNERKVRREWYSAQQLHLKQEELTESSSMSDGLEKVANHLCDIVVTITYDLQVVSVQGSRTDISKLMRHRASFSDFLDTTDRMRFDALVCQVTASGIPQCLSLTLTLDNGPVDASLMVVATTGALLKYIVGINADARERLPPVVDVAPPVLVGEVPESGEEAPKSDEELVDTSCFRSWTASQDQTQLSSVHEHGNEKGETDSIFFLSATTAPADPDNHKSADAYVQATIQAASAATQTVPQAVSQGASARPPLLPGVNLSKAPRAAWSSSGRRHRRNKEAKSANEDGALDGDWEVIGEDDTCLGQWLQRLLIFGPDVLDGEGEKVRLALGSRGEVLLEGGVLSLQGDRLVRTGKSGIQTFFACREDTSSDDDAVSFHTIEDMSELLQESVTMPHAMNDTFMVASLPGAAN